MARKKVVLNATVVEAGGLWRVEIPAFEISAVMASRSGALKVLKREFPDYCRYLEWLEKHDLAASAVTYDSVRLAKLVLWNGFSIQTHLVKVGKRTKKKSRKK